MNSNGFGIGLGVGMLLGYRSGFLARPYSNTQGYNTYEDIHRREKYNRRKDGLLECALANTTVYVKKLINIQGKINLLVLNFRSKFGKLQKFKTLNFDLKIPLKVSIIPLWKNYEI